MTTRFAQMRTLRARGLLIARRCLRRIDGLETGPMTDDELAAYRASIDEVDEALVRLLAERFRITQGIGVFKADKELPAVDQVRQDRQVDRLRRLAAAEGLDPDFCERFLLFVMDEVVRNHRRIAEADSDISAEHEFSSTNEPT